MKRIVCLILAAVLMLGTAFACAKKTDAPEAKEEPAKQGEELLIDGNEKMNLETSAKPTQPGTQGGNETPKPTGQTTGGNSGEGGFEGRNDVAYVMIYNPDMWSETAEKNPTKSTGSIGSQVDVTQCRADELEPDRPLGYDPTPNSFFRSDLVFMPEDARAGLNIPIHVLGEKYRFFAGVDGAEQIRFSFSCLYEGEHCCVWVYQNAVSDKQAKKIGTEFDTYIYENDVKLFGTPRYEEDGGSVNILIYPMDDPARGGAFTMGYFSPIELFNSAELDSAYLALLEYYGFNLDHQIIHINSYPLKYYSDAEEMILSTIAHEFQHLINMSDYFSRVEQGLMIDLLDCEWTVQTPTTWINESMSGYVEEKLYPGSQSYAGLEVGTSDLIRYGQSMYNFTIKGNDIGVYGSVYFYSMYLESLCGDGVFHAIHDYWRTSDSKSPNDAEAIAGAVPAEAMGAIEARYVYPDSIRFETQDQAKLSKITLDFYVTMLSAAGSDVFKGVNTNQLLYNTIDPATLEGGGRIVFATQNGTFKIPDDADPGLIYIGFDSNFRPVTGLVVK